MLGKRSRPIQRRQSLFRLMSSENGEAIHYQSGASKPKAFFKSPRLLIIFNCKKIAFPEVGDLSGGTRSPTSPLDYSNNQRKSPRGFDQGVGLGILAALHSTELKSAVLSPKSSESRSQGKPCCKASQPIPIGSPRPLAERLEEEEPAMEYSESYTCITSHGPKTTIRQIFDDPAEADARSSKCCQSAVFEASSCCYSDVPDFPDEDFLSVCCLCKRQLRHGKDIYMYRGDKAFCSVECRYQQIVSDEKERSVSMSMKRDASPKSSRCYPGRDIYTTGTVAAA
ncbi:hypothetical protein SUGI_0126820 [Cryptomeria japonica]|uniref:FCS-Like Zinc finger 14 n=1 Tax=Cryptomeria japonica TaxID=3369 RepID=UPI0024089DFE|nr:FCS-Like Zinc finger 14 [Cryptomeria japonica]GLJ10360.1 hypothetical protein SUGI_0126820 [Cryptomeria japonica]